MKKKYKKYGVRNIGRSFAGATKKLAEMQRKKKEYLQSPEYQKKVASARKRELDTLNYQIARAKKLKALQKAKGSSINRQVKNPLGIDIGGELGLN